MLAPAPQPYDFSLVVTSTLIVWPSVGFELFSCFHSSTLPSLVAVPSPSPPRIYILCEPSNIGDIQILWFLSVHYILGKFHFNIPKAQIYIYATLTAFLSLRLEYPIPCKISPLRISNSTWSTLNSSSYFSKNLCPLYGKTQYVITSTVLLILTNSPQCHSHSIHTLIHFTHIHTTPHTLCL